MPNAPTLPLADTDILRRGPALRKQLLSQENLLPSRIAILGGSTTAQVKGALELFLLAQGIRPIFYESGYNRYYEDVLSENPDLWNFRPDIVFIHTTWRNVSAFPGLTDTPAQTDERVHREMARFQSIWEKLQTKLDATVIQNNFDLPDLRALGNLEATETFGKVNFLLRLNAEFAGYARAHQRFLLNDILYLSAQVGLPAWQDARYWYRFHMALTPLAGIALARSVAALIQSVYGKSKKCLVIDLDNTLWGGVVGDDGVENLVLGRDHPVGEAYADFQRYVKSLQQRGVILAVCSKNDEENARAGFSHPDSVLKLGDFSSFKANWDSKPDNLRAISRELNIGLDSMVFLDDNPAERALVAERLPEVATPDAGPDVSRFASVLEKQGYFEPAKVVEDDLRRTGYYRSNTQREAQQSAFADYGEFLASLEMTAEIGPFRPVYFERISQLINKTNQFNLTTRRYTSAEVEALSRDDSYIALCGRLADRFGDNGLVSVIIGRVAGEKVEIQTWLMSCRVLKRELELAMFDAVVAECLERGIRQIAGIYIPSKKNSMVAGHYASLGFALARQLSDGAQVWHYEIPQHYEARTRYIRTLSPPRQVAVNAY